MSGRDQVSSRLSLVGVSAHRFRIPFRVPFRTAKGSWTEREGLIVRLTAVDGEGRRLTGFGEASPYPGSEATDVDLLEAALDRLAPQLAGRELEPALFGGSLPAPLACALDVAARDALARGRGVRVADTLGSSVRRAVPVNAVVSGESARAVGREAAAARASGFSCVKLKVGLGLPFEIERERVAAAREALGRDASLRLDANGAWSPEEAVNVIRRLEPYGLALVEQPVPAGDPHALRQVKEAVRTPIAADEDVSDLHAARTLLAREAADVLVVKPMVVGGLGVAHEIARAAAERDVPVIVTTTLDTAIGTAAALHLAAALPERQGTNDLAHGLATTRLLSWDVGEPPLGVRRGMMAVPAGPGLGITVDEAALGAAFDKR